MAKVDPALIFEGGAGGPGTHVLLIGIGDYPYLLDGAKKNPLTADGMEQLQSPPASAGALASWFLEHFENPERPLASLAAVVSARKPWQYSGPGATVPPHNHPRGTIADVKKAAIAWVERANSDRGNQAIFFFCGHGVFSGNSVLMSRDYADSKLTRFDGTINLDSFLAAMSTQQPDNQLFLIDACRTPAGVENQLIGLNSVGNPLIAPVELATRGGSQAKQSVHFATSSLAASWGRDDGVSIYTDALIQALGGGGAQADLGLWVGANGLQTALSAYTHRIAAKHGVEQEPDRTRSGQFKIHKPTTVKVPIYVTCVPSEVWTQSFRIEARIGAAVADSCDHKPLAETNGEEVKLSLAPATYEVAACFDPASPYKGGTQNVFAAPPEAPCCIPVSLR
jgi:hypothetical protein